MKRKRMIPHDWMELRGEKFTPAEVREAMDFGDTVENFGMTPEEIEDMFGEEPLKLGQRLYLAEKCPADRLTLMMVKEVDDRLSRVIKQRLEEQGQEESGKTDNGGIIIGYS